MYKIILTNRGILMWYIHKILLIMRLTTVILIATMMQVSASSFGQRITLNTKNATLDKVIKDIRKQSGYDFLYSESLIKSTKRISITVKDASIEEVLEKCLSNQNVSYKIENNTVLLRVKEPSFLDRIMDHFAAVDVRGRVLDEAGNPLVGATIQVKDKAQAYKTKENGEFEIKGVDEDAVLLVSYVGFKTLEISLRDAVMPLEIKLNVATGELEEVKVVYNTGYQELNKERSTGSFVQIDNELFNRAVGTNVLDRIYNITPGLIYNPTIGGSGSGNTNNVVIRGFSTINANKGALIVVDNFPYEGDLNILNPNDVESVTILKDAAAASIWGVRAGNGVIVITTKKGSFNQAISVGFNSNITIEQKPDLFYTPYISSKDIIDFEKMQFEKGIYNDYDDLFPSFDVYPVLPQSIEILLAARKKNKNIPNYNAVNDLIVISELDELAKHDVRNDINKHLLKNRINQQYSFNIAGGAQKFNYYVSVGYDKNKGNSIKDQNNRITMNFTNTWHPLAGLEISSMIVHSKNVEKNAEINYSSFLPKLEISPYSRFVGDNGNSLSIPYRYRTAYIDTVKYPALLDWHFKPLDDFNYIHANNKQNDTRMSVILKYNIVPWVKVEFQFQNQTSLYTKKKEMEQESFFVRNGINRVMTKNAQGQLVYPWPLGSVMEFTNSEFKAWNIRGGLSINKRWLKHQFSAFGGMELRETSTEISFNTLYGFDSNTYTSKPINFTQSFPARPNNESISIGNLPSFDGRITRNGSIYGNVAYDYNGKYLATISGRIDQSNFFGIKANLRKIPLWSIGAAWNIHMEEFYNINWLSILKFKASYGYTGNTSGGSSYATFVYRNINSNIYVPANNFEYGEVQTPNNPQLTWERVKIINAGIDFALINNRVSGNVEFYQKMGVDLIGPIILDPTTGFKSFNGNYASIKGNGIDFNLSTANVIVGSFRWNTNWLVSFNKNKVTAYGGAEPSVSNMASGSAIIIGNPLFSINSYRWAGLDPKTGDPQIYLADTVSSFTNYNKATKEDLHFSGQRNPKIFGALINTFSWKQFSFSANLTYRLGHYFKRNSIDYSNLLAAGWSGHADYASRWRKPGDEQVTNVPSLPISGNTGRNIAYLNSSILIEKADHIRLQDIRLTYDLSRGITKQLLFRQISFYLYASNLGIVWKANNKGLDPDAYAFGSFPTPRTFAVGLNANF